MDWGNLRNWLSGDSRTRELDETRQAWHETQALWQASPLSQNDPSDLALSFVKEIMRRADRTPALPILVSLCEAAEALFRAESIGPIKPIWPAIESDVSVGVEFRRMLARRRRYAADFNRLHGIVTGQLGAACDALIEALPESCFRDWDQENPSFEVPLIELVDRPADLVQHLLLFPYDDETMRLELFLSLRERYATNLLVASGFPPDANIHELSHRLIIPTRQTKKTPAELVEMYLSGSPFASLMELPVPFHVPEEARFEHCHIVGGTGHGKTQLMQRMIHGDLVAAQTERRSVVVIDSQGDLINRLSRLSLFSPETPGSLADRLILIDPADVEFPAALNLFDAHLERVQTYRPVDRERILNGVIELYETFFGAMLGAELTQKQGVIFKYLARLMITIPGATIHTLMQLMEDGRPFKAQMEQLDGSARYFFQTEFFHPSFAATKKQILRRLWGVLSTPAFERMFAQRQNKLDLFEAMQDGKIILVSTAKDLLKTEGSQLFGRFFIAMLAQAALERSTVDPADRTPTMVYVDEAQEYFDDTIETILNQARKYRVGLTLAHQTLDQLSPRLRSAIHANTSMKCAGGVSAKDARAMADELHTSSDFIESMKRRQGTSEFAVWLKHQTPYAIRLSVPLGFLERQPILVEEEYEALLERNRAAYCGTLDEVSFARPSVAEPESFAPEVARDETPPRARDPRPESVDSTPPIQEPAETPAPRAPGPPRPAPAEAGKGGSQHRYVQHLIKRLAEERGLRAVIEEAVEGGQVDVGLHQGELSVACEISVTSTPEYEAQNLAKCLRAGFARIWAVAPDAKRRRAIRQSAEARLAPEDFARVEFLTTEEMVAALDALSVPEPEEKVVLGYRVTSSRRAISPGEATERRAAVARILSRAKEE
ncbi:hypothetical protein QO010_004020 [Caulobacter ginsengisoli]|uniref:Helicase HerA central domain-containing protein n=1 Tax=Caulobacter ginsengisoli TaxID=400775 RepID=A0ABU0IW29_9CAUL|nr:DUF87 domain-containing protein [Caulobacter ginsengisoli]MDQ0466227.1 hypothetical protein [Caulobacter ginsengisoli]